MKSILNPIEIEKSYNDGLTQKQIANMYDCDVHTIYMFMKKHKIKARSFVEAQTTTIVLSDLQVAKIYNLYNEGLNRNKIAEVLSISEHAVRKILNNHCRGRSESIIFNHKINTIPLSYIQEQLILGSLLGDASLSFRQDSPLYKRNTYEFNVSHCLEQKEYLEFKSRILDVIPRSYIKGDDSFSAGKEYFTISYSNKYELEKIYDICFVNGIKTINDLWLSKIDTPAIAYWFMDDGSSSFDSRNDNFVDAEISTMSFSFNEIKLLQNRLADFGIETGINKHKSVYEGEITYYFKLRIRRKSINKLMDLIEPTISDVDCMKYKIKRNKCPSK